MEIRSITLFVEPDTAAAPLADFVAAARTAFPYPVQTVRLATTPFPDWLSRRSGFFDRDGVPSRQEEWLAALRQTVKALAGEWRAAGIDYLSLGPVQLTHPDHWLTAVPTLLAATDMVFASVEIGDRNGRIAPDRCRSLAQVIGQVSRILDNGFGNLYLTALANCSPGSPFFPVAYHGGGAAHFAVAVESADLAVTAVQAAKTLAEARHNLVTAIETAAEAIGQTALLLAPQYDLIYSGIDFSLAPFPGADKSLAGALEALGLPHLGAPGSLFSAAFVTEAIGRARFPRCGFSGLMLPVLEDSVLARRAAEGMITVNDLLSYAAVCGVGLDTIPLPGDTEEASLAGILLDVAALAARLNKPLTARLMPLPGLQAGDPVSFDFPYFADSRVMALPGTGLQGLLAAAQSLPLAAVR
jgi:uncharacterized protein